jgi:cellulose synthase/poly-beta-1,6-N-acetylglucosamine synthase-like glycosyltransferase
MMAIMFWISCAFIAYVYLGYPLLLLGWRRLSSGAPERRFHAPAPPARCRRPGHEPAVSIVIAARDEGVRLAARIENLLRLRYDGDRQIILVSDGSQDDTLTVLGRYQPEIEVVALPPSGKASALNAGAGRARHDILVFADARQTFEPEALSELTAPFADEAIGVVTGALVLDCEHPERRHTDRRTSNHGLAFREDRRAGVDRRTTRSAIADGIGLYWKYEKSLRKLESDVGSVLGATGAIYAMRRSLWRPLPAETILDDVLAPMRCVLAGYRITFNDRARARDRTPATAGDEARRKARTAAGNWQILVLEPRLLLPWRNPVWLQYVSHKVGRLLVPFALVAAIGSNAPLAGRSALYTMTLIAQCALYLLAAYGARLDHRSARIAYAFVMMNASAVSGLMALAFGRKVWR